MRIPRWQKILMTFLGIVTALMICFDIALYRAFFYNPAHVTTRYEEIVSSSIPEAMDQVSIVFLTDIEYDERYFTDQKADELFSKVRQLNPDVLLLGGDLFAYDADLSDPVRQKMVNWLLSINAPLGKFAVYGEQDLASENHRLIVEDVYHKSQIELLNNNSVLLANQSLTGIRLGGLNITADPNALSAAFVPDQFTLLISHYPDNLAAASQAGLPVGYALAGNSHGTQIDWPLFGGYREFTGSTTINRDHMSRLNFDYDISSGIGCIDVQARLNSPVEILYLTLNRKS